MSWRFSVLLEFTDRFNISTCRVRVLVIAGYFINDLI